MNIYEEVKRRHIEFDHHESDLYIPVNSATKELIKKYKFAGNVTRFTSAIDGKPWYDIPFAYDPFWGGAMRAMKNPGPNSILKKKLTGRYVGYELQEIWGYDGEPIEWSVLKKLKSIPRKISYFFERDLIDEVRKTTYSPDPRDNYYIVKAVDGSYIGASY